MQVLWLAVITSHEATVTVHQLKWRAVMLQCHFLELVLSKHFVSYLIFRGTHFVFHSQLRAICRTRVRCISMENEALEFVDALIIALITGGVSSLGTIAALKTDINWIKRVQQDQEQRIRKLEIPNERTQVQRPPTKRPT